MGRLGRDIRKRKLAKLLSSSLDEPMLKSISAISALQSGKKSAKNAFVDYPEEAVGSKIGSQFYIPPWTLETLVNEILSTPKMVAMTSQLRHDFFKNFRMLSTVVAKLENAEDGIFLATHDVFHEMHRIGQRQFPWQRGWLNAPAFYRSLKLYGSGKPAEYFRMNAGISVAEFTLVGMCLGGALSRSDHVDRYIDLSEIGVTAAQRDAAMAKLTIPHQEARDLARNMRNQNVQTAYKPSILRDFPIIVFGEHGNRLRSPIPDLIGYRFTTGLYLDVVGGGIEVSNHIGAEFENYCVEYLEAMLSPFEVSGEIAYGMKKARKRSPDVLVSERGTVILVAECKAKRMTLEARFADDPVAQAAIGYEEIAKGIFQIWRFFSHARLGLDGLPSVEPDCIGLVLTVDPWLMMARNQSKEVYDLANKQADAEGGIDIQDRRNIAVCLIDDVEFALQHGTADTFLTACRELTSGDKQGWILSVAHVAEGVLERPFPFHDRIGALLPWWDGFQDDAVS